jgi:hypothetical protein
MDFDALAMRLVRHMERAEEMLRRLSELLPVIESMAGSAVDKAPAKAQPAAGQPDKE